MAALRATATEPAAQPGEQLGCTAGDLLGMSECRPRQGQGEGRSRGGGDLRVPCNCHAACASVVRLPFLSRGPVACAIVYEVGMCMFCTTSRTNSCGMRCTCQRHKLGCIRWAT